MAYPSHVRANNMHRTKATAPYNFVPLPDTTVAAIPEEELSKQPDETAYQKYVDKRLPSHDRFAANRHSGYFEVNLETRSPLYIRCPLTRTQFDNQENNRYIDGKQLPANMSPEFRRLAKNTPEFFYTQNPDTPVIPGSSLRGMLRTILEIVGYGKVDWVTDKQLVYRAVGDPSALGDHYRDQVLGINHATMPNRHYDYPSQHLKAGYLKKTQTGWHIQPAQEYLNESFVHVSYTDANPITHGDNTQRVYDVYVAEAGRASLDRGHDHLTLNVAVTSCIRNAPAAGLHPAKLTVSGHMGGGHAKHWHCAIYEENPKAQSIPIPDNLWRMYVDDSHLTRDRRRMPRLLEHDGDPLFYLLDNKGRLVFFGHTPMFRLPYQQSPHALVPQKLRKTGDVDIAEAIFGFTHNTTSAAKQGDKLRAYAGRVFVTDAVLDAGQQNVWLSNEPIVPPILATPKPTSFQHYLVQSSDDRLSLKHYDSFSPGETILRGHKLYWHHGCLSTNDIQAKPDPLSPDQDEMFVEDGHGNRVVIGNSTQHTQFKPVAAGKLFTFKVYFENLSLNELGALQWILELPGNPNKEYCHALGMGKPFGMGAVKLNATLHLIDRTARYGRLFEGDEWFRGTKTLVDDPIKSFENTILGIVRPLNAAPAGATRLWQVERIKHLFKILEWSETGEYLADKEHMNVRIFKERRVLPNALDV